MEVKSPVISEAPSTKFAREKLEAISKFLPVHERLKEKLQERQQAMTDLLEGNQQTFAPITTGLKTALYGDPDDAFRRTDEKPIADLLKEISKNVKPTEQVTKAANLPKSAVGFIDKFTDAGKEQIRKLQLIKPDEYEAFGKTVFDSFFARKDILKDEHKDDKISKVQWLDWIYKVNKNIDRLNKNDDDYISTKRGFEERESEVINAMREQRELEKEQKKMERKRPGRPKKQQLVVLGPEKNGDGLNPITTYHDSQICPDSIVRDVSRLEVLTGGRLAGNNSIEIINESADIAQRLFQNKIIDLHTYREFIDDLMENSHYRGYYSD